MFYNIYLKIKECPYSYLGIASNIFISNSPNRDCIVWVDSRKKAERIVSIIRKRWNPKFIEIQSFERILR